MFTGLIESRGKIRSLADDRVEILIDPAGVKIILADLEIGDSVAINGVCLTAEQITSQGFVATVSPETWQRTTLGLSDQAAYWVNLETSLRVGGKIGGHFVTGHVDGWGKLAAIEQSAAAWDLKFTLPPPQPWQEPFGKYVVAKGSVAVNGISLTIASCGSDWFRVAVIPHSFDSTNLSELQVGDLVNLEGDILSKYVEKLLQPGSKNSEVTLEFLAAHGYG
jgi:riboflavin synthase